MGKNCEALILAPVMQDVRQDIGIAAGPYSLKEVADLNGHAVAYSLGCKQSGCVSHDMRQVEQHAARPLMAGEDSREHIAGRTANIDNGIETRKIVSGGDGRGLLAI
jgi:hypothetical protein